MAMMNSVSIGKFSYHRDDSRLETVRNCRTVVGLRSLWIQLSPPMPEADRGMIRPSHLYAAYKGKPACKA